ncbi:MAG: hypothetical protein Q8N88_01500 [Nanoarchaeota archaeon]|nr:hypothetical protein [Nanoarchaeota archaeon]
MKQIYNKLIIPLIITGLIGCQSPSQKQIDNQREYNNKQIIKTIINPNKPIVKPIISSNNYTDNSKIPLKYVNNLIINNGDSYITYTYKSEEGGIRDMLNLTSSSDLEEAWIYIPEKELWVENGINSRKIDIGSYIINEVFLNLNQILNLSRNYEELHLYHIHPDNINIKNEIKLQKGGNLKFNSKNNEMLSISRMIDSTVPQHSDIINMMRISKYVYDINPKTKILSYTITTLGISKYNLTGIGRTSDINTLEKIISDINIERYEELVSISNLNNISEPNVIINNTIKRMNNSYINIEFNQHK